MSNKLLEQGPSLEQILERQHVELEKLLAEAQADFVAEAEKKIKQQRWIMNFRIGVVVFLLALSVIDVFMKNWLGLGVCMFFAAFNTLLIFIGDLPIIKAWQGVITTSVLPAQAHEESSDE